jgi:hypothetical protein
MRYALRLSFPDRPGMLGAIATALGRAQIDIVVLDVIERDDDVTVDDVEVETDLDAARVHRVCEGVGGVVVEALTVVRPAHDRVGDIALAAAVAEDHADPVGELVEGLPGALGAAWAAAVTEGPAGLEVLAASPDAPPIPAGVRLPFLPLKQPRRFPQAQWMPRAWRNDAADHIELAGVPLGGPMSSVLIARVNGPRFRPAELQRLAELARVAVATGRVAPLGAGV